MDYLMQKNQHSFPDVIRQLVQFSPEKELVEKGKSKCSTNPFEGSPAISAAISSRVEDFLAWLTALVSFALLPGDVWRAGSCLVVLVGTKVGFGWLEV